MRRPMGDVASTLTESGPRRRAATESTDGEHCRGADAARSDDRGRPACDCPWTRRGLADGEPATESGDGERGDGEHVDGQHTLGPSCDSEGRSRTAMENGVASRPPPGLDERRREQRRRTPTGGAMESRRRMPHGGRRRMPTGATESGRPRMARGGGPEPWHVPGLPRPRGRRGLSKPAPGARQQARCLWIRRDAATQPWPPTTTSTSRPRRRLRRHRATPCFG